MHQRFLVPLSLVAAGIAIPNAAMAIGLGDIQVVSQPGTPFKAIIPVFASSHEKSSLLADLPNPLVYKGANLTYPQGWQVQLMQKPTLHVLVTAPTAVEKTTPLLVQMQWSGGQMVREYQVPEDYTAMKTKLHHAVMETRPLASNQPLSALPASTMAPATLYHGWSRAAFYRVPEGTCLSDVAVYLQGVDTVTPDQIMAAIVHMNPHAFVDGNPDQLRAGVVLKLPTLRQLQILNPVAAAHWLMHQTESRSAKSVPVKTTAPKNNPVNVPPHHSSVVAKKATTPASVPVIRFIHPKQAHAVIMAAKDHMVDTPVDQQNNAIQLSNEKMTKTIASLETQSKSVAAQIAENAQHMEALMRNQQSASGNLLVWASLSGNVLLLLLFVWMWNRQKKSNQRIESLDTSIESV